MKLMVDAEQSLGIHVGVEFRRGHVCVAEHFLYSAQIRTAFQGVKMVGLRINLGGKGHVLQASKPQPVVLELFSR